MLLNGKLGRVALAGRHSGELNHAARLLLSLHATLAEYEQAIAAIVANVEEQEAVDAGIDSELFAEGGRLSVIVHRRVETFAALSRLLLERVSGLLASDALPPQLDARRRLLAELASGSDLRVVSARGVRQVQTIIWAESGDAELHVADSDEAPPDDITLRAWLELLEACVAGVVDVLEATPGRTGSRP